MPRRGRRDGKGTAGPAYSVTGLMTYEACPFQYFSTYVCHIPPPVTPAMRRGTSVHKLIADHLRQPQLLYSELDPALAPLMDRFLASRFNNPPMALERPFAIPMAGVEVRGRIDVILPRAGGGVELVDFKSGSAAPDVSVEGRLQLPLYALAAASLDGLAPDDVSYAYFFLGDGSEHCFAASEETFAAVRGRVARIIENISAARFPAPHGCTCFACRRVRRRQPSDAHEPAPPD